ncbi:MAG: XrtB/PEP-CTERM-associated transcriptional regulator EpsA [Burkholderiales bacterium]
MRLEVAPMQHEGACELSMEHPPPLRASPSPAAAHAAGAGDAVLFGPLERESLMLNMDAALHVYARHHFFAWTQGMLQNLVRHEVLTCALYGSDPASLQVESFAVPDVDQAAIGDLIHRDTQVLPNIIKSWEESLFRPVSLELTAANPLSDSPLGRELARIGAVSIVAHGTYDTYGKPSSLFFFACRPESVGPRRALLLELIVPFLHLALVRTRVHQSPAEPGVRQSRLLTAREQEIMKWIRVGKSNIEIGLILGISSLTVKNHVQKILRKLDVQNRTQAVSKALALRILSI